MTTPTHLAQSKIAILVANGFEQMAFSAFQKSVIKMGAFPRIISNENGLVTGWMGSDWGHAYAVEQPLNKALAVDFDMLFVPGGFRSHDKLRLTAHTKRFMNGFIGSAKPVYLCDDAVSLLVMCEKISTDNMKDTAAIYATLREQGAQQIQDGILQWNNVICIDTAKVEDLDTFMEQMHNAVATQLVSVQNAA